eukprot:9017031-Pyramimonas_sp.AAC.1
MHETTVYQQRFQKQQHLLRQLGVEAQAFFQAGLRHFGHPDFQKQAQRIIDESSARTAIAEAQCTQAWQDWAKSSFDGGAGRAHRFTK